MKYSISIGEQTVFRTDDKSAAFKVVAKIFRDGHRNVTLSGGRIGYWKRSNFPLKI